jgi:hypothetical protein
MVPVGARSLLAGIRATQHGDARSNGKEGCLHCTSADRSAGLLGPGATDAEAKHEDVAQAGLRVVDVTEGWVKTEGPTEGDPGLEGGEAGVASLGDNSGVCGLQRSAEISVEAISGRRVCITHGEGRG